MRTLLAVFTLLSVVTGNVHAAGTLVPAAARVDMVHDFSRDTIYISNGAEVLRYHVGTGTFQPPFTLGGSLGGMDLSPDGNTLVVADRQRSSTRVWVHLVDLDTGAATRAEFERAFGEGGTYTAAYGKDGKILVTSRYEGSGWVPLRLYDPATGATNILLSVGQDTMVTASGDGTIIGFAEANLSSGGWGRYDTTTGSLVHRTGGNGTGWFNYEIGVNRNGTHYSLPTYGGTHLYDGSFATLGLIGTYAGPQPIGVVYHPVENRVYYPWAQTTQVHEYDTAAMTRLATYDFEHSFTHTGNWAFTQGRMKISRDGSLLMSTVGGGVRFLRLYEPLNVSNQSISTTKNTAVGVTLGGSIGNGGALSHVIASPPNHGTLSGTPPNLTYTPAANFYGYDSFRYRVVYGQASVEAEVQVDVLPGNNNPVAVDDTARTTRNTAVSIAVLANDSDADGDALYVQSVTALGNGTVSISNDKLEVVYKPRPGFIGTDRFSYVVSDGNGGSATAHVDVTVEKK